MKILEPGHLYDLYQLDAFPMSYGRLRFVKREGSRYPGNVGAHHGTTSQEVLRALIDRAQYVDKQIPAWQTRASIWLMRAILWLYEHRAAGLHHRRMPLRLLYRIEEQATCPHCGHVGCEEHS